MDLQELISRGRFIFYKARGRLDIYILVNGRYSAKEIAKKTKRSINNVLKDLKKIADMELIVPKIDRNGDLIRKNNSIVYVKNPLAQNIPISYFKDTVSGQKKIVIKKKTLRKIKFRVQSLKFPSENEILDICRNGEDQFYEFKRASTGTQTISREIQAFAVTKKGGFVLYGVEDDGKITGTDVYKQSFDQRIQNSIRATTNPILCVEIKSIKVAGTEILAVRVPPWNRRDVYQFHDNRTYIRKGANAFPAKSDELRKLHNGEYVI